MMDMVNRKCPICQENDKTKVFASENFNEQMFDRFAFASRKVPEYMHYRLLLCTQCDLIFASPVPALDWIINEYENADYDSCEEAVFAARTYAELLPTIMRMLPSPRRAMDIGTGSGAFLEELKKIGFREVVGIEPSKAPI